MVYPKRQNPVSCSGVDSDGLGKKLAMLLSLDLFGDRAQRKPVSWAELGAQSALADNSVPWAVWAKAWVVR